MRHIHTRARLAWLPVAVLLLGAATAANPVVAAADHEHADSSSGAQPWLVYGRGPDLYLARPDGSGEKRLTEQPVQADAGMLHADWSPDGSMLAFEVLADDATVWTVGVDGSSPQRVLACTSLPCLQIAQPSWSPDGTQLLVVQYDINPDGTWGPSWLVVADLATGTRRKIARTPDDKAFYFPRWSHDGRKVVVEIDHFTDNTQSTPTGTTIAVAKVRASYRQRLDVLTRPGRLANHPDWHPTKDLIVFSTNDPILFPVSDRASHVFVMRPDGSRLRRLDDPSSDATLRLGQPTWSPDGRQVVLTAAYSEEPGGEVVAKYPAFLSSRGGDPTVLPVRGADPRLQPLQ